MKIDYKKAAILYLFHWQMGEAGTEKHESIMDYMSDILGENGYPLPSNVIYDNDSEPMINWQYHGAPEGWDYQEFIWGNYDSDVMKYDSSNLFEMPTAANLIHYLNNIRT